MTKREMAVVVIPAHQTHFRKKNKLAFLELPVTI